MKKMFARINRLMGKQMTGEGRRNGERPLEKKHLRIESLEDRLLLAVTATDYQNICSNYEEFLLPSSRSDVNIIEIDAEALSIASLKDAISTASSTSQDDLIVLRTSVNNHVLSYTSADDALSIDIDSDRFGTLTIVAYGAYQLTIDAAGYARVLSVSAGDVNLGNMMLRGGTVAGDSSGTTYCGGGLWNEQGVLTLKNMKITANAVSGSMAASTRAQGGGIWNGSGGNLFLYESVVSQNSINAYSDRLGGGVYNAGTMLINRSEVTGNTATDSGGGIYNAEGANLEIGMSSITANTAAYESASMSVYGGGLYNAGIANVWSTTFSENRVSAGRAFGGGVYNAGNISCTSTEFFNNFAETSAALRVYSGGGALNNNGTANLYNCTISGNTSKNSYSVGTPLTEAQQFLGSGILNNQTLNVYNSIIALNAKDANAAKSATATSRGYYVLAPGADWTTVEADCDYNTALPLFATNPVFSAGGILLNADQVDLILAPGSQAIDVGNNGYVNSSIDLTGYPRISNNVVDLGAYEYADSYTRRLDTPGNFNVTALSPTDLILTWQSVSNADYYLLSYSTDQITWTSVAVNAISYEMTVTNVDTKWYFTIQAFSDKQKYLPSDVSATSIVPNKLDVPENLAATIVNASSVYLEWDAVNNADSYKLRYWTITEAKYTEVIVNDTSYTLTKLDGSLVHHFSVCAIDSQLSFNDSDFSEEVTLTPGKLSAPANVTARVVDGKNSIVLSWDAVEHADSYKITWRSSKNQARYYVQTADTSYTFNNLNQNYKYYFTVKAIGSAPYSDSDSSSPEVAAGWSGLTVVNTLDDEFDLSNSAISLREALYYAGSTVGGVQLPATVTFDPDLAGGTCRLSASLGTLEVAKSVTIDASDLRGGFVVDGGGAVRVFTFSNAASEITLDNLTVQNGLAAVESSGGLWARGGGIYSAALSLTLNGCVVMNNSAAATISSLSAGNVFAYGGGIYASGSLVLSRTTVSDNTALATTYTIGGAYRAEALGGGIYAPDLTMTHSTVARNTAQAVSNQTYAIAKGGGVYGSGSVVNSLLVRNTAQAEAFKQTLSSQVYAMAFGGGICQDQNLVITNSTVSKNSAWSTRSKDGSFYSHGGGICIVSTDGSVRLNNSIVLLNNTSYIGSVGSASSFPTGDYDGYDICLYTANDGVLTGNNNISTYDKWSEASSSNNLVTYTYGTESAEASITVTYSGNTVSFMGEDAFQDFLDDFFVNVYDKTESGESIKTEDYHLTDTACWAVNCGDVALAVEADGTTIVTDLDEQDRVYNGAVDIGAYELGTGIIHSQLTVTTAEDVVDEYDDVVSLREAINYANSVGSGTVTFIPSLAGSEIKLNKDKGSLVVSAGVTIDASDLFNEDGYPFLTIDGSELDGRIMKIESTAGAVALIGLIFNQGKSDLDGGAVYSEADSLSISSCLFLDNAAGADGGAVCATGALSISDTSFENNTAAIGGGAVSAGSALILSGGLFRANHAGEKGGAVYTAAGSAIQNSTFHSNTAADAGGALYVVGETNVSDSAFSVNRAVAGGAIGSEGTVTVSKCRLTGNQATGNGGAVAASGKTVLSYSVLSANSADSDGGALYQSGSTLTLINSQLDGNVAKRGGALFLTDGATAVLRNATVTANSADEADGIYADYDTEADLYNTIATLNGSGADAFAEPGAVLNAYKVLSSWTDWSNASEELYIKYDSHYPLFNSELSDGIYTLDRTASQAIDQGINDYALDENGDTLSCDIFGKSRFVKTKITSPEAIVDLGVYECQNTDGRNIQQVYGREDTQTVLPGDVVALAIEHEVVKLFSVNDANTLSLRIHFNSDYLTFDPADPGINTVDLLGEGNWTVYSDTEDYDGDTATDRYILVTWYQPDQRIGLWNGAEIVEIFSALKFNVTADLNPTEDYTTYVRFSPANITANFQFHSTPIEINIDRASFDVDGDGVVNISTDVNLLIRYMSGKRGASLVNGLISNASTRDTSAIETFLKVHHDIFDIDGDGTFNASIDGELLERALSEFTGDALIHNISFTSSSIRTNSEEIKSYIGMFLPGVAESMPDTGANSHVITVTCKDKVVSGDVITLNLAHDISSTDPGLPATTLSLRLYYDSTCFTIDTSDISYHTTGLVGPALSPFVIGADTANEDGDLATDSWIQITWNRESGWTWSSDPIASLLRASITVNDVAADSDAEALVSTIHITSLDRTAGWGMDDVDIPITIIPSHFSGSDDLWLFDIDGSGEVDIATDGMFLLRFKAFDSRDIFVGQADSLLVSGSSTRNGNEIWEYLCRYKEAFDIDGSGGPGFTYDDVTCFMKFFAGFRGNDLVINTGNATRKTGDALAAYIKQFIPVSQRTDPVSAAALPNALAAAPAILLSSALPEVTLTAPAPLSAPAAASPKPALSVSPIVSAFALPRKEVPAPEAVARLWEKPADDWFVPELDTAPLAGDFFTPDLAEDFFTPDQADLFRFDADWPDFF